MHQPPTEYDLAALHAALAEDEHTAELGLEVQVRGGALYLRGSVASEERKTVIGRLVERHAGDLDVRNDLVVEHPEAPTEAEQL